MNVQMQSYASQAFTAEAIPGGMRIVSPFRQITDRGGALDVGTITTEFTSDTQRYHQCEKLSLSKAM